MQTRCTSCREDWDSYELWHCAINDTGLPKVITRHWQSLPHEQKLDPPWRAVLEEAGYHFGRTVINVIRCPQCPPDAAPDPRVLEIKAALEERLGANADDLAAAYEAQDI